MADALLGFVADKSLSLIQNEFATFSELKEKAEKLSKTLTLIKAVLEDAEERQMTDRAVKVWLRQLKDAVHVLDDILEDCSSESLQHGGWGWSTFNPNNIGFRHEVGRRLNEMVERLDRIDQDRKRFGLREGVVRERPSEVAEWRETSSNLASPQVYGREEDKEKVLEFLLSPARSSGDLLSVFPIVGLGGLGKTTLAQMIFNDQRVLDHFPLRIWVCVSEIFTRRRILCSIIEFLEGKWDASKNLDVMERKVQELLRSKRYLLVLDDVWRKSQKMESGVSQDEWDKLKSVLSCGSKGASILVSTRDKDVAEIMGTCEAYELSGLSEEDCWSLFRQYAFGPVKEERPELVVIGKEIVKKCGGSPLAAKALGGLMRSRKGKNEWREVKKSKLWTLPDENGILPALRLSYFHLTPTLKQCFAFCAIFPKDEEIMKQELIHLWMANGFISSRENLAVEEVGSGIWNELCQISFFQDVRINDLGVIYFKMHDLVHDLAQSITDQECIYLKEINLTDLPRNPHHIGFSYGSKTPFDKKVCAKVESLRTLFQLNTYGGGISGWLPTSLRILRTYSSELPLLENLTHLRYLELCYLRIKTLPDSIYNLRKLEILKLTYLVDLHCLPKHLTRLQNLRHLFIKACPSLSHIFPDIHKLSHLRTLSVYIVKTETGHSLAELRDLNLGGELSIEGLGNVGSLSEAQEANLKGKEELRELSLCWNKSDETKSHTNDPWQVFEALQPHPNLQALTIQLYEGLNLPSWMGNNSALNSLVSLVLDRCKKCQLLPPLGKLPSLKKLEIKLMDYVQYVDGDERYDGVEVRAFPSLESLTVNNLENLERLLKVEKGGMFPRLSDLYVIDCPKLQLPFLPCVKNLKVSRCNNELLKSISCLSSLDSLTLEDNEDPSLPEGMMDNLTNLKTLEIIHFLRLKELPYEITKLNALESLIIGVCHELESFPEQVLEGLRSLRTLDISRCAGLKSLPDGVHHLTSLEALSINHCPTLRKRCVKGTGEDWHKIEHIPKVTFYPPYDEDSNFIG